MADFRAPSPSPDEPEHSDRTTTARPTAPASAFTSLPLADSALPPSSATRGQRPDLAAPPSRKISLGRWLWRAIRYALLATFAVLVLILGAIVAYRWIDPPTSTLMLGQRLLGTEITRTWRPLTAISPNLARAVIMSEDAGFCRHSGVDWRELEAAFERGQDGGNAGGGSTISMQVTKNLFLWPSRSYLRKAIEIPLTLVAEAAWTKPRMLEIYLNIAEWGPGIFGAEAAARTYFNKPASALTEREAALLATALPTPLTRNPRSPSEQHRRLGANIEARMRIAATHTQCLTRMSNRP